MLSGKFQKNLRFGNGTPNKRMGDDDVFTSQHYYKDKGVIVSTKTIDKAFEEDFD